MSSEPHSDATPSPARLGKDVEQEVPVNIDKLSDFKVWNPPGGTSSITPKELPDSYFDPTAAELKASYQAQVRTREALANAPLKTREIRERETNSKLTRWPTTTIRVKFPDRTQLEKSFPSTDKIRTVYAFVRNSLRHDVKSSKFVLYQTPPRRELKVSDPKVRDLTLFELQLAPSSVLLLGFQDESLNDVNLRAPLLEYILAHARDLPPPPTFDDSPADEDNSKARRNKPAQPSKGQSSKALPKWLKIGQNK
ncbi:hypothetical protein JB92DRAFT_2787370 [Gautieria morchelliformis]|nr:hypothetical protein JB92DRAFT_2787370 [Gautieria morchelliformis]